MAPITLTAVFNTPGTFSWQAPPGVTSAIVVVWGGGGSGGNAGTTSGSTGGGAGGGECACEPALAVTPSLTYIGNIGAGGLGSASGVQGGGDSYFTGDIGIQVYAHGGGGGSTSPIGGSAAGLGGTGSTNTFVGAGGNGDNGTAATNGGAGGGAGGVTAVADSRLPLMYPAQGWPGNAGSVSTAGAGSPGTFPGGAGGAGSTSGAGTGGNGVAPGGGGGGSLSTGTGRFGGNGANGQVTITWTMNDPVTLITNTLGGTFSYQSPIGGSAVNAQAWGAGGGGFNTTGNAGSANSLVGCTIPPTAFNTGAYDAGLNQETGDSFFVTLVSRGNGGWLTITKKFWNQSDWSTSKNNLQNYVTHGTKVIFALKPAFVSGSTSGPNGGNGTNADLTNLKNFMKAIAAMGFTSKTAEIVFWQEPANPQNVHNPTDYGFMIKSYGPAVNNSVAADGLPFPLVVNVNFVGGGSVSNATDYANAALGLRGFVSTGATIQAIAMDFYTNSYWDPKTNAIKKLLDTQDGNGDSISGIADAAGIPFGLNEFGAHPTDFSQTICTNYFNYLISFFTARISAGKTNWNMVYYDGEGPPTGLGLITSPLSQDPSTGSQIGSNPVPSYNDYRVVLYQQLYDALTSASSSVGGAGGGGGEFAQESALALNDSATYPFAIGAGNALQTGGNSTITGQSVTVTAHGGSAATSTTAGGIGGTGYASGTHHDGGAGGAGGGSTGGGGGGGGSGGTGAAGNAGHVGTSISGGAGGAAVTGGGAGGRGGNPGHAGFNGGTPGGGGGGAGSSNTNQGDSGDGQIVLSGFVTHPAGISAFQLGGINWGGTGSVVSPGNWALGALAFSGTGKIGMFSFVQQGPASTGPFTLTSASTQHNMVLAVVVQTTQAQSTPPAGQGWQLVAAQNTSGASGRIELWAILDNNGGITSVSWTGGTALRGNLYEFAPPVGYVAQIDGTPGTAAFGTPTTSFPVNVTAPNASDLLFSCFENQFSSNPSGSSWTKPGGWTQGVSIAQNVPDEFTGYYKLGAASSGSQTVTGVFSTSTNQVGAAALFACFTAISTVAGSSGQMSLGPLAWGGTASTSSPGVTSNGVWALGPLSFQSPSEAVTFPGSPLPIQVQILINGAWADISNYVYQRDGISIIGRGRPDEASTAQPTTLSLTLNNTDGSFNPYNTSGQFYPFLTRNTQIRLSITGAVTPNGAWYTGGRFIGEVPSWPPQWDPTQTDIYVQIQAAGVLQRMRQSKFLASPLKRYYNNLPATLTPAAYWPCEDGTIATNFASGIPGGSEMFWTGTPSLSSDTSVEGSAPFAQLTSSVWTGVPGAFSAGGQTFNTPGTYQWVCPAGITTVQVQCVGGGGGGSNGFFGPGGGGGEFAAENTLAVTPGKTYQIVVGAGGSGGTGSFSPQSGSNGQNSTFTGDNKTVIANGGGGGPRNSSGGHGSGGHGSSNSVHNSGGNGGSWNNGNGGAGGGSSGGTSSAGNAGHGSTGTNNLTGGVGGSSVAGGGVGGVGGNGGLTNGPAATPGNMPTSGPGGGGGGGGFNGSDQYGKPGGNGFAGQVQIIFGISQVPAPPAIVLREVIDIPAGGGIDGSVMGEVDCSSSGTLATMQIIYHTANSGSFQLKATKTAGGGTLFDSGTVTFGNNGKPVIVSGELTQSTPSQVSWKLTGIFASATSVIATKTGVYTGTLSGVTEFRSNNGTLDTGSTGVGHVSVQYAVDPILNLAQAFGGYSGELAATRFMRLCGEQSVPVTLFGSITDTPQMGPQPTDILVNLLQDCENVDLGMMFERRAIFGLAYVTRAHMQNQNPSCTLDYSKSQIVLPLQPTDDDALTRNDIIATRGTSFATGSSFEVQDTSGPMSINDPPNGVGLYQYSVTANLFADTQLPNFATWLLTLGTVDEFRYPIITVDMTRVEVSDGTFQAVAGLDIGDFVQIINPPSFLQNPINQLCFGFAESMNAFEWTISINAVPEDPWTGDSLPSW